MDLVTTFLVVVNIFGSLLLSRQIGGLLFVFGILRFVMNGKQGHYLIAIGGLLFLAGADLSANEIQLESSSQEGMHANWIIHFRILAEWLQELPFQIMISKCNVIPQLFDPGISALDAQPQKGV